MSWLESVKDAGAFADVKFAVFGCGNRDWVNTYQRVPRLVDDALAGHGATRLVERGEGDASGSEFFQSFDKWEQGLWEKLSAVCRLACLMHTGHRAMLCRNMVLRRALRQQVSPSRRSLRALRVRRSSARRIRRLAPWWRTECLPAPMLLRSDISVRSLVGTTQYVLTDPECRDGLARGHDLQGR